MTMENIKYYKDLNHNYLIIKDKAREEQQNYQHKMITANKMRYFLACKTMHVDQECHFYYEISSKQNMISLYDKNPMDYEQLHRLFEHIKGALTELENYLLDSRCLILQPEYIYGNPETEECFFLYYPYYKEEEGRYLSLAKFLVEKIDREREEAVTIAYKIYEMAQDEAFILSKILDLFTEVAPKVKEKEESINVIEESDTVVIENVDFVANREGENEEKEMLSKHLVAAGILAFVCMVAAAGVFGIRYFLSLSMEELILSMAGSIVLTIMSALLFLYLIFNLSGHKKQWTGERKKIDIPETMGTIPISCDNDGISPSPYSGKAVYQAKAMDIEEAEYGNTVFLEAAMCRTEHKLYGINKGNKYHIDLERLPCTVGKMAGSVDVVIKDSTISRIHARFSKREEGICVTDMNSTNGTFKNGLRLEPNETVLIERGDELRFGRMTFCYR